MKTKAFYSLAGGTGMLILAASAEGAGVVGSGTPASCTEAAFTAALSGGGLVTFNCGPNPHPIVLTSEKTVPVGTTTLRGAGLISISGGNVTRLFVVPAGATLVGEDIVLRNGRASQLEEKGALGGAVLVDGGALSLIRSTIRDSGTGQAMVQWGGAIANINGAVSLTDSIVEGNDSDSGGGIHTSGDAPSLTLVNTIVRNNRARGEDGFGGGIAVTSGAATITGGRLEGNTAEHGGGLSVDDATVGVTDTVITRNRAIFHMGGGVLNSGTLTLTNVTLSENRNGLPPLREEGEPLPPLAAGLYNSFSGVATLVGVTVRNNDGFDFFGGTAALTNLGQLALHGSTVRAAEDTLGLWIAGASGGSATVTDTLITGGSSNIIVCPGTLTARRVALTDASIFSLFLGGDASFINSTISGDASVSVFAGGSLSGSEEEDCEISGTVSFLNSTIAGGQGGSRIFVRGTDYKVTLKNTIVASASLLCGTDEGGQIVSEGFNIATDDSCGLNGPGDKPDTDPKLGPLQYNGGPTPTLALPVDSPAVDGGTSADCPATDQRGFTRPLGAACDVGAFEYGTLVAAAGLNDTTFTASDNVVYEGTVNPGLTPTLVDIYLGALLPDAVTFLSIVEQEPGVLLVTLGPKPVPYRANATAAPLAIVFDYTFDGIEPLGRYHTYAALIAAGQDPLIAANQLSLDIRAFDLVPSSEPEGEPQ